MHGGVRKMRAGNLRNSPEDTPDRAWDLLDEVLILQKAKNNLKNRLKQQVEVIARGMGENNDHLSEEREGRQFQKVSSAMDTPSAVSLSVQTPILTMRLQWSLGQRKRRRGWWRDW